MNASIVTLVIAAATGISLPAQADCGCAAWLLTTQVAEGKPYIVVEGVCMPTAARLVLSDPFGKSVPLSLLTTHTGYNGNVQYVVTPDRAIAPGKHALTIGAPSESSRHELIVAPAVANATPPTWNGAATVLGQTQTEFGCGPAKSVNVQAGADASLAFVELVDAAKKRTGYVRVDAGKLSIGHHMCSGAFELVKGRAYTATVTLLAPARGTSSTSKTASFTYSP